MKKFYTLLLLLLAALPFSAKAGDIVEIWAYSDGGGKVEVFANQALSEFLVSDDGSNGDDGSSIFLDSDEFLEGLYVRVTPNAGKRLTALWVGEATPTANDLDATGTVFVSYSALGDPYYGVYVEAYFEDDLAAIDEITVEPAENNAPVEYFNLQGVKVTSDNLTPGIYVTRQGEKTTKLFIRK